MGSGRTSRSGRTRTCRSRGPPRSPPEGRIGSRPVRRSTAIFGSLLMYGAVAFGPPSAGAAGTVPRFTDVTGSAGIDVTGLGNASSWVDVDADGDLDLFATNSGFSSRVWLYRNDGE